MTTRKGLRAFVAHLRQAFLGELPPDRPVEDERPPGSVRVVGRRRYGC